jgi:hypothetical protein
VAGGGGGGGAAGGGAAAEPGRPSTATSGSMTAATISHCGNIVIGKRIEPPLG